MSNNNNHFSTASTIPQRGMLIAAIGLPGSGKSAVIRELGKLLNATTFHEPEEAEYTAAVTQRHICGNFTAMTWFRARRLPPLFEAHFMRLAGQTVLVDSYYDKLFGLFVGKKGMEWLIEPSDNYFKVVKDLLALDYERLPNADCLVSFELDKETWIKLLQIRGRELLDNDELFRDSFNTQQYYIDAAKHYADNSNCKLIRFKQAFSSPKEMAVLLKQQMEAEGVLPVAVGTN